MSLRSQRPPLWPQRSWAGRTNSLGWNLLYLSGRTKKKTLKKISHHCQFTHKLCLFTWQQCPHSAKDIKREGQVHLKKGNWDGSIFSLYAVIQLYRSQINLEGVSLHPFKSLNLHFCCYDNIVRNGWMSLTMVRMKRNLLKSIWDRRTFRGLD